jgi:hypothetical protein
MNKPLPVVAATPQGMLQWAATIAQAAPSIFNTQPWRWQIDAPLLHLYADRTRQLQVADPDGRLLTVSCGAALHHACTALAVAGCEPQVTVLPDPGDPDLLAEIRLMAGHHMAPHEINAFGGIAHRHTDRRNFTDQPVNADALARISAAATREHAHLHLVPDSQIATVALAAVQASALQLSDPAYRMELAAWTHRPAWSGDGVPSETAVAQGPRRVPVRDFAPFDPSPASPGEGLERGAVFGLIFTTEDTPAAWLAAGQALSAVLLEAASSGLATAPISDITELAVTREQLRQHVLAGIGYPQIAVRIGHSPPGSLTATPRRQLTETVTRVQEGLS